MAGDAGHQDPPGAVNNVGPHVQAGLVWMQGHPLVLASPFGLVALTGALTWLLRLGSRHHRRHARAWANAGAAVGVKQPSQVTRVKSTAAGERLDIAFAPGGHAGELTKHADALASALGAREVRVTRAKGNARHAAVRIVRRDALAVALPTPMLDDKPRRFLEGVAVGIDEDAREVVLRLPWANLLIGGNPGSGKSVILQSVVAAGALDPQVDLYLFDGKTGVELGEWEECARVLATDLMSGIAAIGAVQAEMERRYKRLRELKLRKIPLGPDTRILLVVVDELAYFLVGGDKRAQTVFADMLTDLVRRGRAAGVVVVAATQRPSHDVIPTSLRTLFAYRWALRCTDATASNTILGEGYAARGFDASVIDFSNPGEGYLLHEEGDPLRMRAYNVSDSDLYALVERAQQARAVGPALAPRRLTRGTVGNDDGNARSGRGNGPGRVVGAEVGDVVNALVNGQVSGPKRNGGPMLSGAMSAGGANGMDSRASEASGTENWRKLDGELVDGDRTVVRLLADGARFTTEDMRSALGVSKNTAYKVADRLERAGLVSKARREPVKGSQSPWVYSATERAISYAQHLAEREGSKS